MSRFRILVAAALLTAFTAPLPAAASSIYQAEDAAFRKARLAAVLGPSSWLSVIARPTLRPGIQTLGSAPGNIHLLSAGPATWGSLTVTKEGKVWFTAADVPGLTVDGNRVAPGAKVELAYTGKPTLVSAGTVSFSAFPDGDFRGITVRDTMAPHLVQFSGLETYPLDESWKIEAAWVPFPEPLVYEYDTVFGISVSTKAPGKAVFTYGGKTYEILPLGAARADGTLHFVLRDATSGNETYGNSRFLFAPAPVNGRVTLDFNQLVNPPCAFSSYPPCPLPIPGNRLDFAITAGEKTYHGTH